MATTLLSFMTSGTMIPTFASGSSIIRDNPDPAFDRILDQGFAIKFFVEIQVGPCTELIMKVLHNETLIGEANLTSTFFSAHCQNVEVQPAYRRRGIATAIYVFAEKVFGRPITNFWVSDPKQTTEAQGLWKQSHRLFGHPDSNEP